MKTYLKYINQDSIISFTRENSQMCNITSKYFRIFNNKSPVSWVAHITSFCVPYEQQNYFLLAIVKFKKNLELAYAVYYALPSNIIRYISFDYICTSILYYIYIQYIHLVSFTFLLQNDQNGEKIVT